MEEVAKIFEGGAVDGRRNPKLLRGMASKVVQGARRVVQQRAAELREKAEEALRGLEATQVLSEELQPKNQEVKPTRPASVSSIPGVATSGCFNGRRKHRNQRLSVSVSSRTKCFPLPLLAFAARAPKR